MIQVCDLADSEAMVNTAEQLIWDGLGRMQHFLQLCILLVAAGTAKHYNKC